jgi:hypothetical protein
MNDRTIVSLDASPLFLLDGQPQSECIVESWKDLEFERVTCPIDHGHRRPGKRLKHLNVAVPCEPVPDVMFTQFHEYLMTDRTRDQFVARGITGVDFVPTKAVSKRSKKSLKVWEATISGWDGQVAPESGVRVEEECPGCHHRHYSPISDPEKLIQLDQWDGADVFMIWPLPAFMFVTERVIDLIVDNSITGVTFRKTLPPSLLEGDGFSPGGLALWMPDARAHEIGDPLGIYNYR